MKNSTGNKILNQILGAGEVHHKSLLEKINISKDSNHNIDQIGICGESPIHICLYKKDFDMLSILLTGKYDPNSVNSFGETIFHVAAKLGILLMLEQFWITIESYLNR